MTHPQKEYGSNGDKLWHPARAPASRASEAKACFREEPVSPAGVQTFVPDKNGVKTPFIEEERNVVVPILEMYGGDYGKKRY